MTRVPVRDFWDDTGVGRGAPRGTPVTKANSILGDARNGLLSERFRFHLDSSCQREVEEQRISKEISPVRAWLCLRVLDALR